MSAKAASNWLVFIDTNILLDFYRMSSGGPAKRQLQFIDQNHQRIITGDQVKMEFLKHRQKVIIETIKSIKNANSETKNVPPILVEAKPAALIEKALTDIDAQQKRIRSRIERILLNPSANDEVYKCVNRLFKADTPLNLSRKKSVRLTVRHLARKRYCLGYPPRKDSDTSIGDAVNWEWIIVCAAKKKANVVIVSRDGDYGAIYSKSTYLNDWLKLEFKQRVGSNRKAVLTNRLTDAMKLLNVKVTKDDEAEEDRLIKGQVASAVGKASGAGQSNAVTASFQVQEGSDY